MTNEETSSAQHFHLTWKYGVKTRDDYIEVEIGNDNQDEKESSSGGVNATTKKTKTIQLKRWSTFKCHHFPDGAIVTGFRGRRDYKDGKCEGIMCCKWCPEKKAFTLFVFTISNGYNSTFSEKDFESIELVDQSEFTFYNTDAVKNIKNELR